MLTTAPYTIIQALESAVMTMEAQATHLQQEMGQTKTRTSIKSIEIDRILLRDKRGALGSFDANAFNAAFNVVFKPWHFSSQLDPLLFFV